MKKKFLLPLIFLIPFAFVSCNNENLSTKDPTQKESYAEVETKIKLKEFEDKIGLENLSELPANEIIESSNLPLKEFIAIRETKINKDILNKDTVYQVIERAKYLSNLIYEEAKKEGTIAPSYKYMSTINNSDRLGNFLSKDLALELLNTVINFGDINSLITLIEKNDEKIYEYNYLTSLLLNYFVSTDDFNKSDKNLLIKYLGMTKDISISYLTQSGISTIETLKDEILLDYKNIKVFLENTN